MWCLIVATRCELNVDGMTAQCLRFGILDLFVDIVKTKKVAKEDGTASLIQLIAVMKRFMDASGDGAWR